MCPHPQKHTVLAGVKHGRLPQGHVYNHRDGGSGLCPSRIRGHSTFQLSDKSHHRTGSHHRGHTVLLPAQEILSCEHHQTPSDAHFAKQRHRFFKWMTRHPYAAYTQTTHQKYHNFWRISSKIKKFSFFPYFKAIVAVVATPVEIITLGLQVQWL